MANIELDLVNEGYRVKSLDLPKHAKFLINGKPAKVGDTVNPMTNQSLEVGRDCCIETVVNIAWAASALGRRGGKSRLKTMTHEQRVAIARKAAKARWRNK